jgi:hypothetical protein
LFEENFVIFSFLIGSMDYREGIRTIILCPNFRKTRKRGVRGSGVLGKPRYGANLLKASWLIRELLRNKLIKQRLIRESLYYS